MMVNNVKRRMKSFPFIISKALSCYSNEFNSFFECSTYKRRDFIVMVKVFYVCLFFLLPLIQLLNIITLTAYD